MYTVILNTSNTRQCDLGENVQFNIRDRAIQIRENWVGESGNFSI